MDILIIMLFTTNIVLSIIKKSDKIVQVLGWVLALLWYLIAKGYIR